MYPLYWKGAIFVGQDTLDAIPQIKVETHHCKMFVNDNYVLGTAGTLGRFQKTSGSSPQVKGTMTYPLDTKLNAIFGRTPGTPEKIFANIVAAFKDWQTEAMLPLNDNDRAAWAKEGVEGFLFWYEGAIPMLRYFAVNPILNGRSISFNVEDRGKRSIKEGDVTIALGGRHRAMGFPGTQSAFEKETDGRRKLLVLLQKESELSSDTVGKPFTIFRLSAMGGSDWVEGAEICKANTHLSTIHR